MTKETTSKGLALHWQVIIGLLLGVGYAWMSVQFGWNEFTLNWIQPFGDIFINLLKLIAVPLVLFSIISGVASLGDMKKLGRMGIKTLAIYLTTTMFAVIVGLFLVNLFKPGEHASESLRETNRLRYEVWRDANDIIRLDDVNLSLNPELAAQVEEIRNETAVHNDWVSDKLTKADKTKASGPLQPLVDVVPKNIFQSLSDMQMLQIIFFAIFFGVVVTGLKSEQKGTVIRAVDAMNEVFV
ncbi:MAG TPA: dicarboxylate/amino acid:cation symporter, partial [Flavobacteriales bacterium]|nr:dicarboxylate/amino acid:cation symporter [Flavobacteriales bacterium]